MIFLALGANLSHELYGGPRDVLEEALRQLQGRGIGVLRRSRWYRSPPWPPSDQPWYLNGVAELETTAGPAETLANLHDLEAAFGRRRSVRNEARVLDLDLIDWHGGLLQESDGPTLPHPRMQDRAFVLLPLAELAPDWRHPVTQRSIGDLIAALPSPGSAEPIEDEALGVT
ncbi:2-amino-4-hydroxy-6-hydroxymethyldihydropteridine diphosphokinase [Algihabitans albus]|uniref:2-amino-4-hydroxy-6- hydroxymethyldihydropteridine diphosphokinase n=1 Tax=Algihabitans albus TaxID=2164067 RepID=UPI000E5D5A5B|nr:2-amino-4-hydroxy-6-hydroxymethyldihydropteridine diphosphokinase [Algihabitans albus]